MHGESFDPKRENAKRLELTLERLKDYKHFLESDLAFYLVEQNIIKEEDRNKMQQNAKDFKNSISETFKDSDLPKIEPNNHFVHIFGNSIISTADRYAKNYENGKYFIGENKYFAKNKNGDIVSLENLTEEERTELKKSGLKAFPMKGSDEQYEFREEEETDTTRKKFPELPENIYNKLPQEINLLNSYIEEITNNPEIAKKELVSSMGYLEDYLKYFACDLPTESPKKIKIIKFFIDLENSNMREDEFLERSTEINKETLNILDIEKIKQKWKI